MIEGVLMRGGDISTGIKCKRSLGPAGMALGSEMTLLLPTDLSLCGTGGGPAGMVTTTHSVRLVVTSLFRTYSDSRRNSSWITRTFSVMSWVSLLLKWSNPGISWSIRSISRVTVSVLMASVAACVACFVTRPVTCSVTHSVTSSVTTSVVRSVTASVACTAVSSVTSVERMEGLLVLGVPALTLIVGAGDGSNGTLPGSTC